MIPFQKYNQLMEWRTEMPFAVYDTKVAALRNITQPIYDSRSQWIASRDSVIDSFINRQKMSWSPVVNKSAEIGEAVKNFRSRLSQTADAGMLGRVTTAVHDLRSLMLRLNTNRIFLSRASKMCVLNPVCCEHPERCVPTELKPKH